VTYNKAADIRPSPSGESNRFFILKNRFFPGTVNGGRSYSPKPRLPVLREAPVL